MVSDSIVFKKMKQVCLVIILLVFSCKPDKVVEENPILGHWITEVAQSEWGDLRHETIFKSDQSLIYTMKFVNGEKIVIKGQYFIEDEGRLRMIMHIEGNSEERLGHYKLEGKDRLTYIQGSEVYHFRRVKKTPDTNQ